MKDPEYDQQTVYHNSTLYTCEVCGSFVASRSAHTVWHREQAPEAERERALARESHVFTGPKSWGPQA